MNFISTMPEKSKALSRDLELKLQGSHQYVIGLDEAGRGPLAGPVVAAACYIKPGVVIEGIRDSKQTTEDEREVTYGILTKHSDVIWSVCSIEHDEIDRINILQASLKAMKTACVDLLSQKKIITAKNSVAFVDGNKIPESMPITSQFVIKGDSLIYSIAAARFG